MRKFSTLWKAYVDNSKIFKPEVKKNVKSCALHIHSQLIPRNFAIPIKGKTCLLSVLLNSELKHYLSDQLLDYSLKSFVSFKLNN